MFCNAEPSGWFALANVLVRLSAHQDPHGHALRIRAEEALGILPAVASSAPRAVGWGLVALWTLVEGPYEVTVSGQHSQEFADTALRSPWAVEVSWADSLPAGAQVCRGNVCELPTNDPHVLGEYLRVRQM